MENRPTTDTVMQGNSQRIDPRGTTTSRASAQRYSSQDRLDRNKLDHIVPKFYEVVKASESLHGVFDMHFESLEELKTLIKQNQLHSVACKLMKMFIEKASIDQKSGSCSSF